jgi:hypothetical protein
MIASPYFPAASQDRETLTRRPTATCEPQPKPRPFVLLVLDQLIYYATIDPGFSASRLNFGQSRGYL